MATSNKDSRLNGQTREQISQAFQDHMQSEMEKAADKFWREFDRRCKRNQAIHRQRKQSYPPGPGYACNICGLEGGQTNSHWIQFCPNKNKQEDTSSTDATVAETASCSSPRSLPEFTNGEEELKINDRPNSR